MADKLFLLSPVTISTPGTRVQITANGTLASAILIEADKSNVGFIYIGDDTVTSSNGGTLSPGECREIAPSSIRGNDDALVLSDIYLDTATGGNKARISYIARK